jgi:type IV pilus assembly protein PilV
MREHSHARVTEKGFTILEVIVAISILTVGLLAVASMQTSSIQGNSLAAHVTEGTTLAQDKMEALLALSYDDADLDPAGNPHGETQAEKDTHPGYLINWDVAETDVNGDGTNESKRIEVTTSWTDRGVQRQSVLTCLKTDL